MNGRALPPHPSPFTAGHINGTWNSVTRSSAPRLEAVAVAAEGFAGAGLSEVLRTDAV